MLLRCVPNPVLEHAAQNVFKRLNNCFGMKIALLGFILLLLPIASAVQISSYDSEAVVESKIVHEEILIFVDYNNENSIELLLTPGINNLEASINDVSADCQLREIEGATKITCPIAVNSDYFIKLEFDTTFPLVSLDSRMLFSQEFKLNDSVDKFVFRLKLPERAVLPEETSKFVTPEPSKIYSDGRRIILLFEETNIRDFKVSAIYEPAAESNSLFLVGIFFLALIVLGFVLLKKRWKKPAKEEKTEPAQEIKEEPKEEEKLYLLPDEKGIVHLLKQASGPIRQKDIENQITFSKAKLSRVLRSLEERGIIKRVPRGNTNLVELLKK